MNKELDALIALRDNLIANNRSVKDIAKLNRLILNKNNELTPPCPVIYVDFKQKTIIKRSA